MVSLSTHAGLSPAEGPRARLMRLGPHTLSDAELLHVVAGSAARRLADHGLGAEVLGTDWLTQHVGLAWPAVCRLLAALELGRRSRQAAKPRPRAATPQAVAAYLRPHLEGLRREEMHVLLLGPRSIIIGHARVAVGATDSCPVDPREVFGPAVAARACAVIVAHNHPSGDPQPSSSDLALTKQLQRAGDALGIKLLDHLVVGQHHTFSFLAHGLMPGTKTR